jgi:predicted sugar kinase
MIDYDGILSNDDHTNFFNSLLTMTKEQIMELTYRALMGRKMGALEDNDVSVENKIEALNSMIKWFSDREEYEKCNDLKKIIETL